MATARLLGDLNPPQRQAVTHGDGPLLVIAGAGTGKTTVITRRIAWLVQHKLARPAEILALTFTDKAAGEMEARVDQLLPYGLTDTAISTFHAFGDQLLREHALDLGLPPEFRVLSAEEQFLFLGERFDDIDNILELRPRNNPRQYLKTILAVISRAKDELVSPELYRRIAARLARRAKTDEEKRTAARQDDIARIYAAYEELKAEAGVIDFGDQILKLIALLDREPAILKRLRDRFRFILVDEFQDANIAQYELVKRLLDQRRNLTVVGDDDQSIYRFRGAAVSNILQFRRDFPEAATVVLARNYRSTQPILDAAYRLIQGNNPDRLEASLKIDKRLVGRLPADGGAPPVFHWYAHDEGELDALTHLIQAEAKTTPLSQIAVLVRTNALLAPIAAACARADIAFTASSDRDFVRLPEIRGVMAFFVALVHPTDSVAHVKLALSPFYRLEPAWILAFNDAAKRTNATFDDILGNDHSVAWNRLPAEGRAALAAFRDDLARYRRLLGAKKPGEILYTFLKDRGILSVQKSEDTRLPARQGGQKSESQPTLFDRQPEERQLVMVQNLAAVFDAIQRYESAGSDPFVPRFVDSLDELLSRVVPPRVDLGPDVPAVQLLTVHAAKGLEFTVVFLPFLTGDRFPARRRHEPLALPAELIQETLPVGDEHLEEERRLFYVALTRARSELYLSGAARSGEGLRVKRPSPFVFEALGISETPPPIQRLDSSARVHQFAPPSAGGAIKLAFPAEGGMYFLSPAMIETYATDPYQFYWRYVLKAPQPANRSLTYGTAIHAAVEAYWRRRRDGRQPTLEELLGWFRAAWKGKGFASARDEERSISSGETTLRRFLATAETESPPTHIEETFVLTVPGARIRGRFDTIFAETGEIRDFKTTNVRTQAEADQRAKNNLPLQIYALAYAKRFGRLPQRLVLDFVDSQLRGVLVPDQQLLEKILVLINDVIADIKANRFDPNPDNPFKDYE